MYLIDKGMLVCLFTNNHRKKVFHIIVNVQARNKNFAIRLGCKKNIKKNPFCRDDDAENERKIHRNTISCCHFILEIYTTFVGIFFIFCLQHMCREYDIRLFFLLLSLNNNNFSSYCFAMIHSMCFKYADMSYFQI